LLENCYQIVVNIVVIGAGEVGLYITRLLTDPKHQTQPMNVSVIDPDSARMKQLDGSLDAAMVNGNGSHPEILQLLVLDIHNNLSQEDQSYFRESREKMLGKTLEEVVANRQEQLPRIQKLLTPLRSTLSKQEYLSGETPGFSDYIVFGAFQWARCVSGFSILNADDIIYNWRDKMLNIYEGLALNAVGYQV